MLPHIHILTTGFQEKSDTKKIQSISTKAIQRIARQLAIQQGVDIVFQVNPQTTIPEFGIGGYTPNAHTIFISLDPSHPKFAASLREELPRTLAHELHHAVRWIKPGYGQTLGEALVTEGLAAHFELEVFGGKPNMWDVAVRGKTLQQLMRRARKDFNSKTYIHNDWFFGNQKRSIPRWTGYALGFALVSDRLKKHQLQKAGQLVHVEARDILLEA